MTTNDAIKDQVQAGGERPYECQTCEAAYDLEYYVCPECGGFSVERS